MFSFPYNVTNERFLQHGIAMYFVCLQCTLKRTNYIVKTKLRYYIALFTYSMNCSFYFTLYDVLCIINGFLRILIY